MNIVLTGFMASGKTTVGKILAKNLNMIFLDTDEMIENKYGKISDNAVIATGGGAVLNTKNIAVLSENGTVINLEPDRNVINARLGGGDSARPLSAGGADKLWERFEERRKYYDLCDFKVKITMEKNAEAVAEEIAEKLRNFHR